MNMRDYMAQIEALQAELERKRITDQMERFVRTVQAFAATLSERYNSRLLEIVVREVPDYSLENPQPLNEHETLEIQTEVGPVIVRLRAPSPKATQGL